MNMISQQFEELARMGVWDFLINMSGSDLNLRDIDDLALALAPYRGHNFLVIASIQVLSGQIDNELGGQSAGLIPVDR